MAREKRKLQCTAVRGVNAVDSNTPQPERRCKKQAKDASINRTRNTPKNGNENAPRLSFIELAAESASSPHELLELVFLHLRLAPSLGAQRVHRVVVAQALNVRHVVVAGVVEGEFL